MDIDRTIKVNITLPGEVIEITRERGWGDNPAFYAQQIDDVLDEVKARAREIIHSRHPQNSGRPLNE